jgi:hypothetical protein
MFNQTELGYIARGLALLSDRLAEAELTDPLMIEERQRQRREVWALRDRVKYELEAMPSSASH